MIESLNVLREQSSTEIEQNLRCSDDELEQQLVCEIHCLKKQLERFKEREHLVEANTAATYEEMIDARRRTLLNLVDEI